MNDSKRWGHLRPPFFSFFPFHDLVPNRGSKGPAGFFLPPLFSFSIARRDRHTPFRRHFTVNRAQAVPPFFSEDSQNRRVKNQGEASFFPPFLPFFHEERVELCSVKFSSRQLVSRAVSSPPLSLSSSSLQEKTSSVWREVWRSSPPFAIPRKDN